MHNQEDYNTGRKIYFKVDGKMYYANWEDYQKIMNHPYPDPDQIKATVCT